MEYYDSSIIDSLSDEKLFDEYLKCKSTKKVLDEAKNIISNFMTDSVKINKLLTQLAPILIKPGLKGAVRGLKFNDIVKNHLETLYQGVEFEKDVDGVKERPDWYLVTNSGYIVGYNQIDLWGGGAQKNRANKYLDDKFGSDNKNIKYICVIAKKSPKTKIMESAFKKDKVCYLGGLEKIIDKLMLEDQKQVHSI